MTDPTLALQEIKAAWAELQLTTKGYMQLPKPLVPGTHWANAQQHVLSAEAALASAPPPSSALGVYRDAGAPNEIAAFGTWLGQQPTVALDFFADATWADIESPDWWLANWKDWPYQMVFSVPVIPATGGTLVDGAAGSYDFHFTRLASKLVAYGLGNAIIRPGWEFNGSWYRWSAQSDPASFVAYWRRIVAAMRGPAPGLRFCWCPTIGGNEMKLAACYPGEAYVDYVGMDVYDQSWITNYIDSVARWQDYLSQTGGLNWLAWFAAAHGKPIAFPEWGLTIRSDGHGGGDSAYFVQQMHNWIVAHDVAFHCYFEHDAADGTHRLTSSPTAFPLGAAAYRSLFG